MTNQTENINIRLTKEEKKMMQECAKHEALPVSTMARMIVIKRCREQTKKRKNGNE